MAADQIQEGGSDKVSDVSDNSDRNDEQGDKTYGLKSTRSHIFSTVLTVAFSHIHGRAVGVSAEPDQQRVAAAQGQE